MRHLIKCAVVTCGIASLLALVGGRAAAQEDYDSQGGYYQQQGAPQGYAQPGYYDPSTQFGYVGVHPVPYDQGGGICYEQGAHFHVYAPFDQYLFRQSNGYFYFIGDIGDFGYEGPLWGYNGNHPIPYELGGGYCYINWAHRHHFPPPQGVSYNFVSGYYVYAGAWDPYYYTYRSNYWGYYDRYYRANYYGGVYWTVRPPAIYRPQVVVGAPGVYRTGVTVAAPGGARVTVGAPVARPGVVVGPPGVRAGAVVGPPGVRAGAVVGPPGVRGGAVVGPPAGRAGVVVSPPVARPVAQPPVAAPPTRRYEPAPRVIAPPVQRRHW